MKLDAEALDGRLASPDRLPRALLLHGDDGPAIALMRERVVAAAGGPGAEADMRVTRLTAAQLRADPAALDSALRARGFFPGPVVVVVTDATDGLAESVAAAGRAATGPEARLVVTAGLLPTRSALRTAFEADRALAATQLSVGPMKAAAIRAGLARQGVDRIGEGAVEALEALSATLDGQAMEQLFAKLFLWLRESHAPLSGDDVAACAPLVATAEVDAVALAVLARDAAGLHRAMARTVHVGSDAVGVVLAVGRLARHALDVRVAMEDGRIAAEAAVSRAAPPVPWPLRKPVVQAAAVWSRADLERLVRTVQDLDARLRSTARGPEAALIERSLLRLVLTAPGGR